MGIIQALHKKVLVISMTATRMFRRVQAVLVLALFAAAALLGACLDRQQGDLADQVLRLHVLANSDSDADQALKLQVRDAVLDEARSILPADATREEALELLSHSLPQLAQVGADVVGAAGYTYPVTASLEEDAWFPTKDYGPLSLPTGSYTALRLVIGEGVGQNWWCVVFPPLCLSAVSEPTQPDAVLEGLDAAQTALVTGDGEEYVLKFKLMELVEGARQKWENIW